MICFTAESNQIESKPSDECRLSYDKIKTRYQLLFWRVFQPFGVVRHGGYFCYRSFSLSHKKIIKSKSFNETYPNLSVQGSIWFRLGHQAGHFVKKRALLFNLPTLDNGNTRNPICIANDAASAPDCKRALSRDVTSF